MTEFGKNINEFAFNLYRELKDDPVYNLFYSPYCILSALAMAYAGARGKSAQQMADVMRYTAAPD